MKNSASEPGQSLMFGNGDGKFKLTINKVKVNSRSNDRYVMAYSAPQLLQVNQNKSVSELYLLSVIKTLC